VNKSLFIGLMSGTSLDGADAALVEFSDNAAIKLLANHSLPYPDNLRQELIALHHSGENELERTAILGNQLATLYAEVVQGLLNKTQTPPQNIQAIGCHGQTIRHRPELGFTLQIGNAALLAELTEITVVADFRSRDIAAGGQGAPLVPAFHQAAFAHPQHNRVIINIGGIANLSYLPSQQEVLGFDSGPGNMLMDVWAEQHLQQRYDVSGRWAMTGKLIPELLQRLLSEPYFALSAPKSTGRDLFNLAWLQSFLPASYQAADIQRTLLELTAISIADAVNSHCPGYDEIYLCGGGAHNDALVQCLQHKLHPVKIGMTDDLSIHVNWVEAAAFAWLAKQTLNQETGNLPLVTGAQGKRVLGAIYAR
jgi:anhydro-N-acetylmuramic acid kinase